MYCHVFLVKVIVRGGCFCCPADGRGFTGVEPCVLALGLRGDKTVLGESVLGGGAAVLGGTIISPVTLLRTGGLPDGRPTRSFCSVGLISSSDKPMNDVSPPRARRRAFSCLDCTDRKCCNSSCHLISSRPASFERVGNVPTDLDRLI